MFRNAIVIVLSLAAFVSADDAVRLLLHLDGDTANATADMRILTTGSLQWQPGAKGQALSLDGKSGLHIWQHPALHVGDQSWTMQCHIKPVAEGMPKRGSFLSVGYGHGRMLDMAIIENKRLTFLVTASSTDTAAVSTEDVGEQLFDGNWHHVAAVVDRTRGGEMRLYLDGKQVNTNTDAMPHPIAFADGEMRATVGATAPWYIAKSGFTGGIDEVRMDAAVPDAFAVSEPSATVIPQPPAPPAEAAMTATDAASTRPITLTADNVLVLMPRFAETPEYRALQLIEPHLKAALNATGNLDRRYDHQGGDTSGKVILAIGRTNYVTDADLIGVERHGVRLMRKGNVIIICGGTSEAHLYAAREFLDRFLGVRFYMPGDLFTSKPQPGPVTFSSVDVVTNPYVHVASSTGYHNTRESTPWAELHALNRRESSHQHNMWERFPPDRYANTHPEIYPILDGKRYIPGDSRDQRWHPTFSEPKLLEAAVDSATRYFAEHPTHTYIGFSVQDSHVHSEIDLATPEVKEHGKTRGISILYWRFMNNLAERLEKTHPDKQLIGIVYAQVRLAPPFKLHPNVVAWVQWKHSDNEIDKRFVVPGPDYGKDRMHVFRWLEIASTIGHHDWAHGNGYFIPRLYPHSIQQSFLELERRGAALRYTHGEAYPNWGLDGPKLYLMAKTWWDPHTDPNVHLRQYCDDLFPGATDAMYDYFSTQETLFQDLNRDLERKLNNFWGQFDMTPDQRTVVVRLRGLLAQAAKEVMTDAARERIALFSKTYRLTEMFIELANSETFNEQQADAIRTYVADVIAPNPMAIYRRGSAQYLNDTLERALDQVKRKDVYRKRWDARRNQ